MNCNLSQMTFHFFFFFDISGLFLVDINTLPTIWLKDAYFLCYHHLLNSRADRPIHCAQNVKTVRLCSEFNKSVANRIRFGELRSRETLV